MRVQSTSYKKELAPETNINKSIQAGCSRKMPVARSGRLRPPPKISGFTQLTKNPAGWMPATSLPSAASSSGSGAFVAISAARPKTTALIATPIQTVALNPSAGKNTNAAQTVPATAPTVLVAYSSAILGPSWRSLATTCRVSSGSVAPINPVGSASTMNATTR